MGTAILNGLLAKLKPDDSPSIKVGIVQYDPDMQPSSYKSKDLTLCQYTAWVRSQASLERLNRALGDGGQRVTCVSNADIASTVEPADVVILGFPPGRYSPFSFLLLSCTRMEVSGEIDYFV